VKTLYSILQTADIHALRGLGRVFLFVIRVAGFLIKADNKISKEF
jgi:hypothetical protein